MALLRIPCILVVMTGWHITTTAPQPPPLPEETLYASKFERFVKRRTGTYVLRSISWAFALAEFLVILASQAPSALVAQRILAALSHPFSPLNLNSSHNTAYKNIHLSTQCIAATLLAGLGGYIRYRCYRELGTLFTFQVAIRKDHRLVTTGPYGAVRHPGYAGVVMCVIGVVVWHVGAASWARECGVFKTMVGQAVAAVFLALVTAITGGLLRRMNMEDAALEEVFGQEWREWAERVPHKLIPGVY